MQFIKDFQEKYDLSTDGIIGPKTLYKIKEVYCIDTNEQVAHLVGQCHHESAGFTALEENLNYSASALLRVFRKYFDEHTAQIFARKPEKIANRVYADRMGNGPEESGDGWKYRGRGVIQLTGKNNYQAYSEKSGVDYVSDPEALSKLFFEPAVFFFEENNIWRLCRTITDESITRVTRIINGGYNGLDHRKELTRKYASML